MPAKIPTVISGAGVPSSAERVPFSIIQPPTSLPQEAQSFLSRLQQNVHAATLPSRSNPLGNMTIVQKVTLISGVQKKIRHGLGQPFASYDSKRTYPTYIATDGTKTPSSPFAVVEVDVNMYPTGITPSKWLILLPYASGCYDIAIYGG